MAVEVRDNGALANGDSFDVVVTDLMMPGVSGMDVFAKLEQTHPVLAKHMLFTTGGAFTPESRELTERLADRVVPKPITTDLLLERIQNASQSGREKPSARDASPGPEPGTTRLRGRKA